MPFFECHTELLLDVDEISIESFVLISEHLDPVIGTLEILYDAILVKEELIYVHLSFIEMNVIHHSDALRLFIVVKRSINVNIFSFQRPYRLFDFKIHFLVLPVLLFHVLVNHVGDVSVVSCSHRRLKISNEFQLGHQPVIQISFILINPIQLNKPLVKLLNNFGILLVEITDIICKALFNPLLHQIF